MVRVVGDRVMRWLGRKGLYFTDDATRWLLQWLGANPCLCPYQPIGRVHGPHIWNLLDLE